MRERQGGEHQGEDHGRGLSGDDNPLPIGPVGSNSSEGREKKHRDLAGEADGTQQQPGSREFVDEPGLSHRLHPCAHQRNELSAEKQLEITVPQRPARGLPIQLAFGCLLTVG